MPSPAPKARQEIQEVQLKVVGGNKFGRYDKISQEQTFNMIVSDDALVDYAGYKDVLTQSPDLPGRAIYSSVPGAFMICVWGEGVFKISQGLSATFLGNLATGTGDVFISENNNKEIAITDQKHLYVYNYGAPTTPVIQTSGIDFMVGTFPITTPGYISFQNSRLIIADLHTTNWYLSDFNKATVWSNGSAFVGALQSKPDTVQAAVPTPGGGNNLVLFGHNVIEQWQDINTALFPYQRSSTFNVDYGCLNASSIAALDTFVVWLSANEQSGTTLMVYSGNQVESISTDGMDYTLNGLTNPSNCTGFLFRQDGHLLYQFTFPDDNLSYVYDFNTKLFFTVTDENYNYHIARNVVFFNNHYYFVSLKGGNLYRFGTQYTNFEYEEGNIQQIPRDRVCPPLRLPSQRMYIIKSLGFTVENGQPNEITVQERNSYTGVGEILDTEGLSELSTEGLTMIATEGSPSVVNTITTASENIDLSVSKDGGVSFGSSWRKPMNPVGKRRSRMIWQRLGQANDSTYRIKFVGYGRFVAFDGVVEVFQ